ncbi:hypothetical protein SYNPS1DRAFT_27171 [Syncephalis pseudoplumigaleata]|uniref:Uncharacterized protein n=1 Tax=Syncephalis pseudoplumigaleata TaxID=1712513 RepID=A0A4P9Z432_9FUNG|nr:hypothetical protein SYNPS1DRAFT_27171 [Syncephalis pseudoplumigaleata]|eukprot:RKP27168.1 hypothetical protein SYNPS1DRAFT_27171 [Syncephalis pseudoplumigaleata]
MTSPANLVKAAAWLLVAAGALNGAVSLPQNKPDALATTTSAATPPSSGILVNDASAALASNAGDNIAHDAPETTSSGGSNSNLGLILGCDGAAVGVGLIVAGLIQHRRMQNRKVAADKLSAEPSRELDPMAAPNYAQKFHGSSLAIPADSMVDITPPKSPRRAINRDNGKAEHSWFSRVLAGGAMLSPNSARAASKTRGNGGMYPPEEEFDDTASISSTGYDQGSTSHLAVQISPRVMRVPAVARLDKDGFDDATVQAPGLPSFSVNGGSAADWAASVNAAGQELANTYGRTSPLPVSGHARVQRSSGATVALDLPNWAEDDTHAADTAVLSPKVILGRSGYVRSSAHHSAITMDDVNVDDYIEDYDEEDDDEDDDDDIYDSCSDSDTNSVTIDVDQAIEAALPPTRRRRRRSSSAVSKTAAATTPSGKPPVPPRRVTRLASAPSATTAAAANSSAALHDIHDSSWRQHQWNPPRFGGQLNEAELENEDEEDGGDVSPPFDANTYRVW